MKLEELIEDLKKFIRYIETTARDPEADERYKYANYILDYLKELKRLRIKSENISRELITRTNKLKEMYKK